MTNRARRAVEFLNRLLPSQDVLEKLQVDNDYQHLPLTAQDRRLAQETDRKISTGAELTQSEQFALEAIIIPDRRPAIDIVKGDYAPVIHPDWRQLNSEEVKARLKTAFRSVGRIEVAGFPEIPYGGTGFVVGDGLIMTNRHVAEIFSKGLGETNALTFKEGITSAIDFARDPEGDPAHQLNVRSIRMIHPHWDLAILSVDGLDSAHPALPLRTTPGAYQGLDVAVVGYPAFDYRNAPDVQDRVFNRTYNVKRLLPGKIGEIQDFASFGKQVRALGHDASTLGGASGSAVIDLQSGSLMGLHFAGVYLVSNYAVPAWELAMDSRIVDAGVRFAGEPKPSPEITERWWQSVRTGPSVDSVTTPEKDSPPVNIFIAAPDGEASQTITIPIEVSIRVGAPKRLRPELASLQAGERVAALDAAVLRKSGLHLDSAVFLASASRAAYGSVQEVKTFAASVKFPQVSSFDLSNVQGFWCADSEVALLAFRGTSNPGQWLRDARFFPASHPWGHVHIGFRDGVAAVENALLEFDQVARRARYVWITGHSLGGALAVIAAARMKMYNFLPNIYTYGQPAPGLSDFADRFAKELPQNLWRFINQSDIVPRVPPGPFYQHTGAVKRIVRPGVLEAITQSKLSGATTATSLELEALREYAAGESISSQTIRGKETQIVDVELPQLDMLQFSRLQMSLGAVGDDREQPALEGALPWISDHSIDEYVRLLEDILRTS